ncbi:hypothetical protein K2173_004275 [Erythroxylum novogranatense]|uniref:Letm1 RBD domain-containing protein n=1 Tax=Erythroxylum novogranatense TaxID=1862640 RepID=A0AAV8U681_9ROSI|nr:hypothetical protein K2173_004275 [Erythroxylum novogranatense]
MFSYKTCLMSSHFVFLSLLSSFMASHLSLQLHKSLYFSKCFGSESKRRAKADAPILSKVTGIEYGNSVCSKNSVAVGHLLPHDSSSYRVSLRALSPAASSEQTGSQDGTVVSRTHNEEMEFNRIHCLVWVLHEAASSFSLSIKALELSGSGTELAMAWNGKDVHEWHKRIAYQVAVIAMLRTAIEVEILLSHDRQSNLSPVRKILTPRVDLLRESIESQLKLKHPELVQWFRVVELPRVEDFFTPLLSKWSIEYAGSGVAGIVIAISCCVAAGKLGSQRISCALLALSCEDIHIALMDLSYNLVAVDKLHQLATEAGFEQNFLYHFGAKVLPCEKIEELEFWIGLAQQKLSAGFRREIEITSSKTFQQKDEADRIATLGLFAYLGRKTRLFLSRMNIKDLDELVWDFLSYLECGSIFIYPELASVSAYQSFMEIVINEIGWLDFYASYSSLSNQERKRSKQHAIQAEKEMILSKVLTVCYDVFSGFAHFSRSTQQTLDAELLRFLLCSQSLLTTCMDEYFSVYDCRSWIAETGVFDQALSVGTNCSDKLFVALEAQKRPNELALQERLKTKTQWGSELRKDSSSAETGTIDLAEASSTSSRSNFLPESLIRKYGIKVVSTSADLSMGTQLLIVDIMDAVELLLRPLRGNKTSARERTKLKRILTDIATLIPVTIIMIIPLSAVGHAAILAAIQKYAPFLIPSPYSSERLDVVKQLKRTQKMEAWSRNAL